MRIEENGRVTLFYLFVEWAFVVLQIHCIVQGFKSNLESEWDRDSFYLFKKKN